MQAECVLSKTGEVRHTTCSASYCWCHCCIALLPETCPFVLHSRVVVGTAAQAHVPLFSNLLAPSVRQPVRTHQQTICLCVALLTL